MANITVEVTSTELYNNLDTFLSLPTGTIITELDDVEEAYEGCQKPLLTWQLKADKTLDLVANHYDWDRPLSQAEIDRIKLTKLSVAEFFINKHENDTTYGEYKVYSDAEWKLFKHTRHAGAYLHGKRQYNIYYVNINKDQAIGPAIQELKFILDLQAKRHPNRAWLDFQIFEHNLSEGGSYMLRVHRSKLTCKITPSYSKDIHFATLELAMLYIKNNLWYEEVTSRDENDE